MLNFYRRQVRGRHNRTYRYQYEGSWIKLNLSFTPIFCTVIGRLPKASEARTEEKTQNTQTLINESMKANTRTRNVKMIQC
jgi:hypothetical protein